MGGEKLTVSRSVMNVHKDGVFHVGSASNKTPDFVDIAFRPVENPFIVESDYFDIWICHRCF